MEIDQEVAYMQGEAKLPRRNGELVFHEPWEGRVFGMAVVLHREGLYPWDAFRDRLIAEVNADDHTSGAQPEHVEVNAAGCKPDVRSEYYEHWLAAFEKLLIDNQIITRAEFESRKAEFVSGERDEVF